MPFEGALEVTGTGEQAKLEVKMETFMDAEDSEYGYIGDALTKVQKHLDFLKEAVDKSDIDEDEPRLLFLAIERELENSIPERFDKEYKEAKEAGNSKEAADLITKNILKKVQDFVIEKAEFEFRQTDKLQNIIDTIDNALWFDQVDIPQDIEDVMKKLDKDISKADIAVIQAKWLNPNITDGELLALRQKVINEKGSSPWELGKKAIKDPYGFTKIAKALEEAGANK
jgi:hypothetical protein